MQTGKGAIIRLKTSLVIAGEHSPQLTVREPYSVDAFNALSEGTCHFLTL